MAPGRLAGKVLIVTGGTQGVGEGIALQAAAEGAAGIAICGRNAERGTRVAAAIEAGGAAGLFVPAQLESVEY